MAALKKESIVWAMRKEIKRRAQLCNSYLQHPTDGLSKSELKKLYDANIMEIEVAIKNLIDYALTLFEKEQQKPVNKSKAA